MEPTPPRVVYLYGHAECSLCDRLEAMIRPLQLTVVKRDIRGDPTAFAAYRYRIPVLTDDAGRVLVEGRPDEAQVRAALGLE